MFRFSDRRPLSEISPHAKSAPIQIPKISVNFHDDSEDDLDDEVFVNDENFAELKVRNNRKILFPSYGTSPSQAVQFEDQSPFKMLESDLFNDRNVKKLGKGSFGTVVLGVWKGISFFKDFDSFSIINSNSNAAMHFRCDFVILRLRFLTR